MLLRLAAMSVGCAFVCQGGTGLSVATLNVAMEKDAGRILRDLRAAPAVRGADLVLFQEVAHSPAQRDSVAAEVARALGLNVVFAPAAPGVYDRGLAILSRFPLGKPHVRALQAFDLRFHQRARFALGVTAATSDGPVQVWNVHLDTRINALDRVAQLEPVLEEASASGHPAIIAGDFNTNSFYWLWNVLPVPADGHQAAAVRRLMAARGFTAPLQAEFTTHHFGMHLDWIYLRGFEARAAGVHAMPFSDHQAVVVRLAGLKTALRR